MRKNSWQIAPSATVALIVVMFIAFVVAWVPAMSLKVVELLACDGTFERPWTFLTYPFAATGSGSGILFLALQWLWLYWIGTSIERSDGWKGFLVAFFGYTLLSGLLTAYGGHLLGAHVGLVGSWLPISALTCIWAGRNPSAEIRLMMVIPVSGKVLAVITAVVVVLMYGAGAPMVGVLAALPCLVGWFHGTGSLFKSRKRPIVSARGHRGQSQKEFEQFIGQVRTREKEREERERLRKLLEGGSAEEDPSGDDQG